MKVDPDPLVPDTYVRSTKQVLIYQTRWGPKARAWPKPRTSPLSAYEKWHRIEFGKIAAGISNMQSIEYETAVNMTRGTAFVPRDYLMRANMGLLYQINLGDGTIWEGWRVTTPNVQWVLEQLTNVQGSIPVRGHDFWEWIDHGSENDVLTMVGGMPKFVAPAAGPVAGNPAAYGWRVPVAPVTANFTAESDSVGALTVVNQPNFGFTLLQNGVSGAKITSRGVAAPTTTTWSWIAGFRIAAKPGAQFLTAGLYLRKTGNSKYIEFGVQLQINLSVMLISRFTNPTTFSANAFSANIGGNPATNPFWLRLDVDATNNTFSYSADGVSWLPLLVEAKTAWLTGTPDRIGFFMDTNNASSSYQAALTCFDFAAG